MCQSRKILQSVAQKFRDDARIMRTVADDNEKSAVAIERTIASLDEEGCARVAERWKKSLPEIFPS